MLKIRGGREIDSLGKRAGKGALIRWEQSMTLGVSQDQTLFAWKGTEQDHPTPKINAEDGVAYTLNSRDYKGVMLIVISEDNRNDFECVGYTEQMDSHY